MNPYLIEKAEEHIPGWHDYAERGELKHITLRYRVELVTKDILNGEPITPRVKLWLIFEDGWSEEDDDSQSWIPIASWPPEMMFVVEAVRKIVRMWFYDGCRHELTARDICDVCYDHTWREAMQDHEEWGRIKAAELNHALEVSNASANPTI